MVNAVVSAGQSAPLGATIRKGGVNFALYSENATAVTLCLFSSDGKTETQHIPLPGKTGHIWHGFISELKAGQLYGYRVDGPYAPKEGHRFNANKLLIDPYAPELFGQIIEHEALYGFIPGHPDEDLSFSTLDSAPFMPKSVVCKAAPQSLLKHAPNPNSATLIYEAHVKGLTQRHPKVTAADRGQFRGLAAPEITQHLQSLGVTHLELLPVHAFHSEPRLTQMGLSNYWGYNSISFFALHQAYGPSADFAKAVKTLQQRGIAVILDVVYNHTAESWRHGPTLSLRGIDNAVYYRLQEDKSRYLNHTGTGNMLNIAHPQVRQLVLDSLRDAVERFGVDGFRFDLGPVIGRTGQGFLKDAPIFDAIKTDPILKDRIMIAEPWDIGPGGYQLGNFPPGWREWNDRYRDDVRAFWTGEPGGHRALAGRLLGSADLFDKDGRAPDASVNFITAHDGFNLTDLVSYAEKHNHANGEENRDGHGHNLSVNFGHEGPSDDPLIITRRARRKRSLLATLFMSQGTPMILAGDEIGHTQQGNNNAYCQDNEISWLNWAEADEALAADIAKLSDIRARFPQLTPDKFFHGEVSESTGARNVLWLRPDGSEMTEADWHAEDTPLGLCLNDHQTGALLVFFNRGDKIDAPLLTEDWTLEFTSSEAPTPHSLPPDSVSVYARPAPYLTPEDEERYLFRCAEKAGILSGYHDNSGGYHPLSTETAKALLDALGKPPQTIDPQTKITPVYGQTELEKRGKIWGVTAALYGLRSVRNWGLGDFEDLAQLAEVLAAQGADFIGINPVHALFPSAPHLYAPYSPSSRQFLNIMHIAVDQLPEWDGKTPPQAAKARKAEHVDYPAVYAAKHDAFAKCFAAFDALPDTHHRKKAFKAFCKKHDRALTLHCLYDVLFERLPKARQSYAGWKNFARIYQDPQGAPAAKAIEEHRNRIRFYAYLQFCADSQLRAAQSRARKAGMAIGLYLDFAVGVVPGSADVWIDRKSFAQGATLGAPGDMANPDGQAWGLAPYSPAALLRQNMEPYHSTLSHLMGQGGAVRIDHILGHLRSFWMPDGGAAGGYMRYPFAALTHMIGRASNAQQCVVFGEDLGTVPQGFREALSARALMGTDVYIFDRDSGGGLKPRDALRRSALCSFTNHDFPTLTGFWQGADFAWREDLGIGDHPEALSHDRAQRERDKRALLERIGWHEAAEMTPELMAALQGWLAGGPSLAFAVTLEDLTLDPDQPNIPGTTDEVPNWRRKMKIDLAELARNKGAIAIMAAIDKARKQ